MRPAWMRSHGLNDTPVVRSAASPEDALEHSLELADTTGVRSSVRPGRSRSRTKAELDEKIKKPGDDARKKAPPARKAPARGRYVDEYARPAG